MNCAIQHNDKELQAAYEECERTCVRPGPCYLLEYLYARYEYNKLLVARGMLDARDAESNPYKPSR